MSKDAVVYTAPRDVGVDLLEETLLDAFLTLRDALTSGRPTVAVVRDSDILGHGDPVDAALANAVVGLVRTLATEGTSDGWAINALAVPDAPSPESLEEWAGRLAVPHELTGGLVRLGELHLGRVPV